MTYYSKDHLHRTERGQYLTSNGKKSSKAMKRSSMFGSSEKFRTI